MLDEVVVRPDLEPGGLVLLGVLLQVRVVQVLQGAAQVVPAHRAHHPQVVIGVAVLPEGEVVQAPWVYAQLILQE